MEGHLKVLIRWILELECASPGRQVAQATNFFYGGARYLRVLSMELASGHSSGAWDFEVSAICVENFCIPVTRLRLLRLRYWIEVAQDDVKSRNLLLAAAIRLRWVAVKVERFVSRAA